MEDWWVSCYAADIHDHLRKLEKKRPLFCSQSPQLHVRESLVEWVCLIAEKCHLCTSVQHLAVYFLDIFMDNHKIHEDHLHLFGLGCILVAAKLEEKDSLIPRTSELNAIVSNMYNLGEYMQMELAILNFFDWEILIPTAAHFVEYYAQDGVNPSDVHCGRLLNSASKGDYIRCFRTSMKHYVCYFLSISLHDYAFLKFSPSLVAASCVEASRICLLLSPVWPTRLEKLTNYKREQLSSCVEFMLRILEMEQNEANRGANEDKQGSSSSDSSPCSSPTIKNSCGVSSSPCSSPATRSTTILTSSPSDCD